MWSRNICPDRKQPFPSSYEINHIVDSNQSLLSRKEAEKASFTICPLGLSRLLGSSARSQSYSSEGSSQGPWTGSWHHVLTARWRGLLWRKPEPSGFNWPICTRLWRDRQTDREGDMIGIWCVGWNQNRMGRSWPRNGEERESCLWSTICIR